MRICVRVSVCMWVRVCARVCVHLLMHERACAREAAHVYAFDVRVWVRMQVRVRARVRACVRARVCMYDYYIILLRAQCVSTCVRTCILLTPTNTYMTIRTYECSLACNFTSCKTLYLNECLHLPEFMFLTTLRH